MGVEFINNPNDVEYVDEIDEILTNPQYVPIMDIDDDEDIENDQDLDHSYMMHSPVGNWSSFDFGDIENYEDNLDDDTLDDDPDSHNSDVDSPWCDYDEEEDESDGELRGVMMNDTFVLTGRTHLITIREVNNSTSEESSNTDSNDNEQSSKPSAPEGIDLIVTTEKTVNATVCNDNSSDGETW